MTIKAIETEYKGYRFRSRLEARWAVFFETMGIPWDYETEGFEVDGTRYLPDFRLRGIRDEFFVEIKPLDENVSFESIYLAGKLLNDGWRSDLIKTLKLSCERFYITGPHGYEDHDAGQGYIVDTCLEHINESSIVFANLDTADTAGTLVELGYAKAKGKRIIIRFEGEGLCRELWFANGLTSEVTIGGTVASPLLEILSPLTSTYDKCRKLSNHSGLEVILLKGDPMNVVPTRFYRGSEINWAGYFKQLCRCYLSTNGDLESSSKIARAARFEFGEKG